MNNGILTGKLQKMEKSIDKFVARTGFKPVTFE